MIEIEKLKSNAKTKYDKLKPGDIFNFGANEQAAVGLKTIQGHVLIESCYGVPSFEHISPLSNDVDVILHGHLIKLGVKE